MPSEHEEGDRSNDVLVLKARMMHHALYHQETIDSGVAIVLRKNGLMTRELPEEVDPNVAEVLTDPNSPRRFAVCPGPLVVMCESDSSLSPIRVSDFLVHPNRELRQSALTHFERFLVEQPHSLTPGTTAAVRQLGKQLREDDSSDWPLAARAVRRAIETDFYCNVAGLRQSLELRFETGYREFLSAVLRPQLQGIETIHPPVINPADQHDELVKRMRDIAAEDEVQASLQRYVDELGYLPLVHGLSLSDLLLHRDEDRSTWWQELWAWVDRTGDPVARYHVCEVFLRYPDTVPLGESDRLWSELVGIIDLQSEERAATELRQAWLVRCDLARHFCHHIEALLPGQESERVAALSWWLCSQVSAVLPIGQEKLRAFHESTVLPVANASEHLAMLAKSVTTPSSLRYMTLFVRSMWSASALSAIGSALPALGKTTIGTEVQRAVLSRAYAGHLLTGIPRTVPRGSEYYAFERPLIDAASRWCELDVDNECKEMVNAFSRTHQRVTDSNNAREILGRFTVDNEADQVLSAHALRMLVALGMLKDVEVLTVLEDAEWRERVFTRAGIGPLHTLVDAFLELQCRHGAKWISHVPHYYALGCEMVLNDEDRRRSLFAFTVMSCVAGDSVSAIQRLTTGSHRQDISEECDLWHERLSGALRIAPGWLAARLRGALSVLHVT